jgi:hypothetical protein
MLRRESGGPATSTVTSRGFLAFVIAVGRHRADGLSATVHHPCTPNTREGLPVEPLVTRWLIPQAVDISRRFGPVFLARAVILASVVLALIPIRQADAACPAGQRCGAAVAPRGVTVATLDLNGLETRLRDTRAIGVLTKISLKNQVDALLDEFRHFHDGDAGIELSRLREEYDLLVMKVLSLLQPRDPALAHDVAASREALWGLLVDPQTFSTLRTQGRAGA